MNSRRVYTALDPGVPPVPTQVVRETGGAPSNALTVGQLAAPKLVQQLKKNTTDVFYSNSINYAIF